MKIFSFRLTLVLGMTVALGGMAQANIWMDENWEDGPFTQGNGNLTTPIASSELDVYANTQPVANTVTASPLTNTGATVTTKAFDGAACYQLDPGNTLSVGQNVQDPRNGNFVIHQFAVNVDPIPAAGTVATYRYNWDTDDTAGASPDHSFFVRLDSTGTAVDVIAGEDVANSPATEATIGQLTSASDWVYITLVMQNGGTAASYSHANLPDGGFTNLAPGVYIYASSTTPGITIPFATANGTVKTFMGWSFTVASGVLYVDDMYWEGGMDSESDGTALARRAIRPFNKGTSSVSDWPLFQ